MPSRSDARPRWGGFVVACDVEGRTTSELSDAPSLFRATFRGRLTVVDGTMISEFRRSPRGVLAEGLSVFDTRCLLSLGVGAIGV